ncbi:hypothetical protein ElyMa_003814300 [Elysia marginata]|uniref:Uncharacterized protein n=1 Tax=Elysia marginata TaxID=1093978 RepID=A0AAV4FGH4_9GAST|nr:hypothetical protein ElyMa_003814300 [Elysia marginata]
MGWRLQDTRQEERTQITYNKSVEAFLARTGAGFYLGCGFPVRSPLGSVNLGVVCCEGKRAGGDGSTKIAGKMRTFVTQVKLKSMPGKVDKHGMDRVSTLALCSGSGIAISV